MIEHPNVSMINSKVRWVTCLGHSPAMNSSTASRASSSLYCTGGDFMK